MKSSSTEEHTASLDIREAGHLPLTTSANLRTIAIVGAGGHGRELADIVRAVQVSGGDVSLLGVVDDGSPDKRLLARAGLRFLGPLSVLEGRALDVYVGVGDPCVRQQIASSMSTSPPPLTHPTATIGSDSYLGDGSVLAQGVIITTNVILGQHTHVNVATTISHDCVLGDFVTVCPGVRLTGSTSVGDGAFIGASATVLPGVRIGRGAVIGAGAVVTRDVQSGQTVAGTPARAI